MKKVAGGYAGQERVQVLVADQGDRAAAPARAGEAAAQRAGSQASRHQRVQLVAAALVLVPAAVLAGRHQLPQPRQRLLRLPALLADAARPRGQQGQTGQTGPSQ